MTDAEKALIEAVLAIKVVEYAWDLRDISDLAALNKAIEALRAEREKWRLTKDGQGIESNHDAVGLVVFGRSGSSDSPAARALTERIFKLLNESEP